MELEASALHVLGDNYGRMGDYGKAMACLGQALVIASELGGDRIGLTYCAMGDVLVAQEGREKEAILGSLRKAIPQQYLWGGSSNLARHTRQLGLGTMILHLCRKAYRLQTTLNTRRHQTQRWIRSLSYLKNSLTIQKGSLRTGQIGLQFK